jgi:hypothetical protein
MLFSASYFNLLVIGTTSRTGGQRDCGFECEGEKYPQTSSHSHTGFFSSEKSLRRRRRTLRLESRSLLSKIYSDKFNSLSCRRVLQR